jgi:hypothetical protein
MLIYLSFGITTFTNSSVWAVLGAARAFRWVSMVEWMEIKKPEIHNFITGLAY